ncbi:major facilitator superfamily domain-containing protein [Apodospora peruviana]|uniref:Major facilitator superfamily domain-containing protein n=1 Tax=Apodospora peruviana TaxID=516989 RepID=A0AAE0I6G7_9PEZI|nr:major facilitator superfamily domain-containing protein [Apodospora peruviana]
MIALSSLENTVIVTSLPVIVEELKMGRNYVWVGNIFSVVQPLFGQLSNLFGRRHLALFIVAIYTLGSGIAGGAKSSAMLPAGRAVQGAGSGGISMIETLIIADLVPLRDRGNFQAIIAMTYAIGMAAGPVIGGLIVQNTTRRWWPSSVSVLLVLTWAGAYYSWSSPRVFAPLILGLLGLFGLFWLESLSAIVEPVMPLRLFATRTSIVIYLSYPAQFVTGSRSCQLLLLRSPEQQPVPCFHIVGFAFLAAGFGSLSVLDRNSSTAEWVCLQILPSVGAGIVLDTLLPAFQAGVDESDAAAATASWTFIRSFGNIWGVAIPAAIFNTYTDQHASEILVDATARERLQKGDSYTWATKAFIEGFPEPSRTQTSDVFSGALSRIFLAASAVAGLAFLLSFIEREVHLRTELETEFGLEEKKAKTLGTYFLQVIAFGGT